MCSSDLRAPLSMPAVEPNSFQRRFTSFGALARSFLLDSTNRIVIKPDSQHCYARTLRQALRFREYSQRLSLKHFLQKHVFSLQQSCLLLYLIHSFPQRWQLTTLCPQVFFRYLILCFFPHLKRVACSAF